MPRKGENIYKRKDGRWEGRYILSYDSNGKAKYSEAVQPLCVQYCWCFPQKYTQNH